MSGTMVTEIKVVVVDIWIYLDIYMDIYGYIYPYVRRGGAGVEASRDL